MRKNVYRTMRGVELDMASLIKKHKNTVAVSPLGPVMNAEGKPLKSGGIPRSKVIHKETSVTTVSKLNPKFSGKFNNKKTFFVEENEEKNDKENKKVDKKKLRRDAELLQEKIEIIAKNED